MHTLPLSVLAVVLVALPDTEAAAKCVDPRGCFTDICRYPGNVVQLTTLGPSTRYDSLYLARVDEVHLIDSEMFPAPAIGAELELARWSNQEYEVGQRLIALSRPSGNIAWPVFGLNDDGTISCLTPGMTTSLTLTESEFVGVALSQRCDRAPLPLVTDCDDDSNGCDAGLAQPSLATLALITAIRWLRRKFLLRQGE